MTYYDDISDGYEELHRDEQLKKIAVIRQFLKPKKTDSLLDVGCGTGLSTAPWNCKRTGIDPARKLIKKARINFPEVEFFVTKAENLPFSNDEFDIIISITAIQNFHDLKRACEEITRVIKPEGKLVITCLKKSPKLEQIKDTVYNFFNVYKEVEEDKDFIWFASAV